ncbi:hypothetical protein [Hyphobacterium indicum]|uniref:hypothetical protein n=1 Tax=Hyphobacterium indicum TaxID=2162714 RepID=UPI000D6415C0|nr:hypothetical protein [Hyphobacterium indicum]
MTETGWIIVWDFRDAFPWYLAIGPAGLLTGLFFFGWFFGSYMNFVRRFIGKTVVRIFRIIGLPFLVVTLTGGLIVVTVNLISYLNLRSAVADEHFRTVDGIAVMTVINDEPKTIRLSIDGRNFEYTENRVDARFTGRFTDGSEIESGMELRVSFVRDRIIRIERREQPEADTPR